VIGISNVGYARSVAGDGVIDHGCCGRHQSRDFPRAHLAFARIHGDRSRDREGTSEKVLVRRDFPASISAEVLMLSWSPEGTNSCSEPEMRNRPLALERTRQRRRSGTRASRRDGWRLRTYSPDARWIAYNDTRLGQSTVLAKLRVGGGGRRTAHAHAPLRDSGLVTHRRMDRKQLDRRGELISADGKP
jgi:hypothetical protein